MQNDVGLNVEIRDDRGKLVAVTGAVCGDDAIEGGGFADQVSLLQQELCDLSCQESLGLLAHAESGAAEISICQDVPRRCVGSGGGGVKGSAGFQGEEEGEGPRDDVLTPVGAGDPVGGVIACVSVGIVLVCGVARPYSGQSIFHGETP